MGEFIFHIITSVWRSLIIFNTILYIKEHINVVDLKLFHFLYWIT